MTTSYLLYKSLSVGSLVEFTSKYTDSQLNVIKQFKLSMDNGDLKNYSTITAL